MTNYMKSKMFWIALFAILFLVNNSIWGQSDYAGTKTVISAGNVDLSEWIVPTGQSNQRYLLNIVVEDVDPQLVFTGVNTWTSVDRSFPDCYPDYSYWVPQQWAPSSMPGAPYSIIGIGVAGYVIYDVSYISDPWIGVDGVATTNSPQLSGFNGTIVAENYVELKVSDLFVDNWACAYACSYLYRIFDDGSYGEGNYNQPTYKITDSGRYVFYTVSGRSPVEVTYIDVVITNTVSEVVVSPQSGHANRGESVQLSANVVGTKPGLANQDVIWAVSGIDTEHSSPSSWTQITQDGLLTIGITEPDGAVLTVTATSAYDPSKSGTATVIVGSPPPVINYYTVTAHTNPPEAPAVTIYEYIDGSWNTTISDGTFDEGQYCLVKTSDYSIDEWRQICWTVNGDTINDAYGYYHTGNYTFIVTADTEIVAHFTRTTDIPDPAPAPPIARVVIYDLAGKK